MKQYDLIVIGSGVGLTVLERGLEAGLECALIESGRIGGTCLTRGCIPSKVLTSVADSIREAEHSKKIGIQFKIENLDWSLIAKRMWSQIDESREIEKDVSKIPELTIYRGVGEFTGKYTLKVQLPDNSYSEEFRGKKIVLASGARSIIPPIKGLKQTGFVTTETFFGDKFPDKPWESLMLIGGGIISAEFAHIFSALGTRVTIIEMNSKLIATEEREISDFIEINFKKHMDVLTGHKVISANAHNGKKYLDVQEIGSGTVRKLEADEIFICAGRCSNSDLLKVDKCGIETEGNGWIKTNEYLETNVPDTWAIGDANGKYQFRHKANSEAEVCKRNIFGSREEKLKMDYSAVPWAIFTDPQVGHVGMTESEAIDKGRQIYRAIKNYSSVAKGFAIGYHKNDEDDGFVKLILDKSMQILGAHVAGPHAALLVQQFVYLMNSGFTCNMNVYDISSSGRTRRKKDNQSVQKIKSDYACPGAGSVMPIFNSMVIHPSLNEVAGWILDSLEPVNIHEDHIHS